MNFTFLIDQATLHVMSCQFDQLVTSDEIQEIMILRIRSILPDVQTHVFHKANKFPDYVALEVGKRSISFLICLKVYVTKHGAFMDSML